MTSLVLSAAKDSQRKRAGGSLILSGAKDPLRKCAGDPSLLAQLRIWDPQCKRAGGPSPSSRLRTSAAVAMLLLASAAHACPVCFGGPDSLGKGTDAAIWFLLSVVGFVQLGIVALFFSFWRRAKEMRRRRDSFHLLEGGTR